LTEPARSVRLPPDLPEAIRDVALQGTTEAATRLAEMGASPDRRTAKAARTALFALRRAGIEPASASRSEIQPPSQARSDGFAVAFMTAALDSGIRLLAVARSAAGTPAVMVQISEERGLLSCRERSISPAELQDKCANPVAGGEPWPAAFVPITAAHRAIAEALEITRSCGGMIPHGARSLLAGLTPPDDATDGGTIYEVVSRASVADDPLERMTLRHYLERNPVVPTWPTDEEVEVWVPKLQAVVQSRIVMTPAIGKSRIDSILDEAVSAIVTEDRRRQLVHRLEWDALVFWHAGEQDLARMAARHAQQGKRPGPVHEWAMARAVVSLRLTEALRPADDDDEEYDDEDQDGPGPTIIVPGR